MKRKLLIGLGVLFAILLAFVLYGVLVVSKLSPQTSASVSDRGLDVKVVYCQPYKKGRLIFGEEKDGALQPYGKYWRLGANAATEITFSKDVSFAGQPVKAGTYRMYAVPGAETFDIVLNSELGVYFAVREPNYSLDVLKVKVPVQQYLSEAEQFTISFATDSLGVNMDMFWDKTLLSVPISSNAGNN
jgi:Protein of unknown function (DUF2911)